MLSPGRERRRNRLTVTIFMLPQLALMKLPVLGAAAVFPMAASAAWLVDFLASEGQRGLSAAAVAAAQRTPTKPPDMGQPGRAEGLRQRPGGQQGVWGGVQQQSGAAFPSGHVPQPSAPPLDPALLQTRV